MQLVGKGSWNTSQNKIKQQIIRNTRNKKIKNQKIVNITSVVLYRPQVFKKTHTHKIINKPERTQALSGH